MKKSPHLPISIFSSSRKFNYKTAIIQKKLNEMYLALFNSTSENYQNWNHIRDEMVSDVQEVISRINSSSYKQFDLYDMGSLVFAGFEDNANFNSKKINIFFNPSNLKDQITLFFYKHNVLKNEIISFFTSIANKNTIIENSEFITSPSVDFIEKWKRTLYSWIGEKILIKNEFVIVILKRFIFEKIESQGSNAFLVWYKYFDNYELVPVKIIFQKNNDEKEVLNENVNNSWFSWFFKILIATIPAAIILILLFVWYVFNLAKAIFLKFKLDGKIHNIQPREYEIPLLQHIQNSFENDLDNNLTMVTSVDNSVIKTFMEKTFRHFIALKKSIFYSKNEFFGTSNNQDIRVIDLTKETENWDENLEKFLENPEIKNNNLQFMKWGIFDAMRCGKFTIKNFDYEFIFKIPSPNFQKPSTILIEKFFEKIKLIFSNVYVSKNEINQSNVFLKTSEIIIKLLDSTKLTILGNNYFFSSDSFWIQNVEINTDFISADLNHILFANPLSARINFI